MYNYGKQFELLIGKSFSAVEGTSVVRLHDQMSGYKGSTNISDFIIYKRPYMNFIECKSVHGNRLSMGAISEGQWRGLLSQSVIDGVNAGVLVWFIDHDITRYFPIASLQNLCDNDIKSIRFDDVSVPHIDLCGKKLRVFFRYDVEDFFTKLYEWG